MLFNLHEGGGLINIKIGFMEKAGGKIEGDINRKIKQC